MPNNYEAKEKILKYYKLIQKFGESNLEEFAKTNSFHELKEIDEYFKKTSLTIADYIEIMQNEEVRNLVAEDSTAYSSLLERYKGIVRSRIKE